MNENEKPVKPDDKGHSIVEQQRKGLARLKAAVQAAPQIETLPTQRPGTAERWARFCRLWEPMDTVQSFSRRHPEWGHPEKVQARIWRIKRRTHGLTSDRSWTSPWQVVTAYLASLPAVYRRPTND